MVETLKQKEYQSTDLNSKVNQEILDRAEEILYQDYLANRIDFTDFYLIKGGLVNAKYNPKHIISIEISHEIDTGLERIAKLLKLE